MPRCALIVEFHLASGGWPSFQRIVAEHARLTRAEEPGCLQFDLLHDEDAADHAILVEIYADRAAYDAHRENPRMPAVNAALAPLTVERKRTICTLE